MPLEQAIWRIDSKLTRLMSANIAKEIDLERYIEDDIGILDSGWLLIGRQVVSDVGPIDLLAIDRSGALVIIELKRQQTTREITAQALDYAAWVESLRSDGIATIYKKYCERWKKQDAQTTLDAAFQSKFGAKLPAEELNNSHKIVLVASELDARTERVVRYLAGRGVSMNILFFQTFSDGDRQFLSRVWMLDEVEIEEQVSRANGDNLADWNGEYYASFGVGGGEQRNWEDAVKYGYISAGGGKWYSNTLSLLVPGSRVWVNVPGWGYVGVGQVAGERQRASEFSIALDDGTTANILDVIQNGPGLTSTANDQDRAEYFVPIKWIKTVPLKQAVYEVGLFGNQNSVCKPRAAKWQHTVERLKQLFDVE